MVEFKELENRFKVVFKGKKRFRSAYNAYTKSVTFDLFDCYKAFSSAKRKAYEYCIEQAHACDGFKTRIISHNVHVFTYGFLCVSMNICYFCYITPTANIAVPVYCLTNEAVQI